MENALLIGLSRQMSLRRELDVVANNVANINTSGFKADGAIFQEFLMPVARADQFAQGDRKLSFVQDRSTWHDMSSGPIQQTGNPLDASIDGEGFFAVQTPRGERYTRNGAFQINATGQLVNSDGHAVLGDAGPLQFQPGDKDIIINKDGSVAVQGALRGKIRLVQFAQQSRLQKDGGSTFKTPQDMQPQQAERASIAQGHVEKSNVRGVVEVTRMIEITRNYTQVATMLEKQGDMRRNAIEKLAEVPA